MKRSLFALSPGDVLHGKRYRLLKQLHIPLSQQGWRTDWLASDTHSSGKTVLLHQINAPSGQEELIQTITQHLKALARRPGFLPVIDVFREQGEDYIVQFYPEGESLASLLEQHDGLLPERQLAEYGVQVCTILSRFAQSHPLFMIDPLSPETILISPDRRQVWLLHFPCFSWQDAQQEKGATDDLAPEEVQVQGSVSSALYSFAAILHRALAGYTPHKHQPVSYPPVRILNPHVTPQMEALLARALHSSLSQRLTDPSQMRPEFSKLIASYSSPSSTSASLPLATEKTQIHQHPFEKRRSKLAIAAGLCSAVFLLLLTLILYPLLTSKLSTLDPKMGRQALYQEAFKKELHLELQTYQTKHTGLSGGHLVFDTYPGRTKADIDLKQQAASALQHGNPRKAADLLAQAIAADQADGEARIYHENLQVLESGAPSIAIVLGLVIDSNPSFLLGSRADLESAFLAQHEINTKGLLPHHLQLRLLIDNSGKDGRNVATVTQFIANRVTKAGNPDHIVAVVGWPFSEASINACDILTGIHVPMVSQAASSVKLSGSSPYFFRVNPPDDQQGKILASVAVQQLHAKTVMVLQDTTNPYSVSLANAFSNSLKKAHATVINAPDNFTVWGTTVSQYEQIIIPYAIAKKPDLIFLAGYNTDGVRLAHALGESARAHSTSTFLTHLKILGGDALDSNLLLGQGNGPDTTIAANFSQDMRRLIFTAFTHPDEWAFQNIPLKQWPALFTDWRQLYQHATVPESYAIMTYDAIRVITRAATLVPTPPTGQSLRDALASLGHGKVPAFQGVSGRISFDNQGNPTDKAIVVLDIEQKDGQNTIVLRQIVGKFF